MYCKQCNAPVPDNTQFCPDCGARIEKPSYYEQTRPPQSYQQPYQATQPQPQPLWQQQPAYPGMRPPPPPPPPSPPPAQKNKSALLILAIALPVLLIALGAGAYFLFFHQGGEVPDPQVTGDIGSPTDEPPTVDQTGIISYSYLTAQPTPVITYTHEDKIFPSLYRMLDALVSVTGYCENGSCDVMISVEIPGFTQHYSQKVTLTERLLNLRIAPPLLTGDLSLNSEKSAQLVISATEIGSGREIVQDSINVKIYSKFDMIWWTEEYGQMNTDNILAWMTPDSPHVLELKRDAIDYLEYISDGEISGMLGYQDYGFDNLYENTWVQAVALQGAMSDYWGVRYNNASFSIDKEIQQRVMMPDDVLDSRSGICVETALTIASALQSASMNVMLVFPPGHAQVAVDAWPDSGDYILIETTVLPMEASQEGWNAAVIYMEKEEWWGYLDGTGEFSMGECYVLDCALGQKLGIVPLSN